MAEKKAKAPVEHPKFAEMIQEAIVALKERTGSSGHAIKKYIGNNYKGLPTHWEKITTVQLRNLVAAGKLVKVKASYKLGEALKHPVKTTKKAKLAAPKEAKKPAAPKATKPKASAKPKAKKAGAGSKKKAQSEKKPKAKAAPAKKAAPKKAPAKATKAKTVKPKVAKTATKKKATPSKKAAPKKKIVTKVKPLA